MFNKTLPRFEVPVIQYGTSFERKVLAALCDILMGQTRSYRAFAAGLGKLAAALAVAQASGANVGDRSSMPLGYIGRQGAGGL